MLEVLTLEEECPVCEVAVMSDDVVQVRVRLEAYVRQVVMLNPPQISVRTIVGCIPFRAAALVVKEDSPATREQRAKRHLAGDEQVGLNRRDLVAIGDHEVDARPVC